MSTILPPPSMPLPQPTATPAPVPVVIVTNPPAAIAELAQGAAVRAEIVALLARGLAEVETDFGKLQIRAANFPLRMGAELDLQLLRSGPQPQFLIRAVDGNAVAHPAERGGSVGAPNIAGTASASGAPASNLLPVADRIQTTVPSTGGNAPTSTQPGPPAAGSIVGATVLPRPPGTETTLLAPTTTQPSIAAGSSQTAPGDAALAPAVPTRLAVPGTRLDLRLLSVIPSAQSTATPAATSSPGTISGIVTAFTPTGHPIVETPIGLLSLDTAADVRVGNRLTFEIVPSPARADPLSAGPAGFTETFVRERAWPTLEQALAHLSQRPTDGGPSPAGTPVPQPGGQLATHLLSVLSGLNGGDIRAWLGDSMALLEQDRPELAARLNDEFAQLARLAYESSQDDWRTAIIPFFNGSQLEPVQMHLRGGKSQKGEKKNGDGSRFIIDLTLSRLGRFQLDGFMKNRGEVKNLDLIVRTDAPLPLRMRRDLNRIFNDFAEAAGLRGGMTFQAHAQFVDVPLLHLSGPGESGMLV